MAHLDVFKNLNAEAEGREFVALLHTSGASVHLFAKTAKEAEQKAADFVEAERQRQARAEANREVMAQRRGEKNNG